MAVKLLALIGSLAIVVFAFWLGQGVPFEDQWPLYEALRTTASIIFAVVGAWLAIIYPDRLKLSFRQPAGNSVSNGGSMSRMFTPIVHSTAILCLVLLIGIIAPLLKKIDFLLAHIEVMRSLSYGTLAILTLWQLWTVVLSLVPADVVASQAGHDERHQKTLKGLTQQTGYVPKEPD